MPLEILKVIWVELILKMVLILWLQKFLLPIHYVTQIVVYCEMPIFEFLLFHKELYRLVGGLHRELARF